MKQIRNFIGCTIAATLLFVATGCENEYITKEYYTNVYGSQVSTNEYVINPRDWQEGQYDDGRKYLYVACENRDITDKIMQNGAVLAYMWFTYDVESNSSSWNLLPYVYPYSYTNDKGEVVYVGENFRFEYEKGSVVFIVEDLDGCVPDKMVAESIFKVVVIENM
ncbi:MAG: hypothetical protein MJ198_08530 [Bacteroidales bacterium]|nr:hypothetical protein [Bacteroidales bacterium]